MYCGRYSLGGEIHADRRAGEVQDDTSRVRGEVAAWTARAQELEPLVHELAGQAPIQGTSRKHPGCCRGWCGAVLEGIRARYPAP